MGKNGAHRPARLGLVRKVLLPQPPRCAPASARQTTRRPPRRLCFRTTSQILTATPPPKPASTATAAHLLPPSICDDHYFRVSAPRGQRGTVLGRQPRLLCPTTSRAAASKPAVGFRDAAGVWDNRSTLTTNDPNRSFLSTFGTNGRTCATCHTPNDAWTATPARLPARFWESKGGDRIFASLDGTDCPTKDSQTPLAHAAASSLLLGKGLLRIALSVPPTAEFAVSRTSNPCGCGSTTTLSLYRRIPMAAKLRWQSEVMWDGRESAPGRSLNAALIQQASNAVTSHSAVPSSPAVALLQAVVNFELGQFAAQSSNNTADALAAAGATGGPRNLAKQNFTPGANEPFTANGGGGPPPAAVFNLYSAWQSLTGTDPTSLARAAIARGEPIFNTRSMLLRGVAGLNERRGPDQLPRTTIQGTCGTCHNTPNVGNDSSAMALNIGLANADRRTPDLPRFTLLKKTTGATVQTSDPGRALVTGKWADIGKFTIPQLRALSARAPSFHNGSAANLEAVVDYYDRRFALALSPGERQDLVLFLKAL